MRIEENSNLANSNLQNMRLIHPTNSSAYKFAYLQIWWNQYIVKFHLLKFLFQRPPVDLYWSEHICILGVQLLINICSRSRHDIHAKSKCSLSSKSFTCFVFLYFRSNTISSQCVKNFGRSLLGGYCHTYIPDLVLHGINNDEKLKQCLLADLLHAMHVS